MPVFMLDSFVWFKHGKELSMTKENTACYKESSSVFDYCLVSKSLIAVAVLPIVAAVAASLFTNPAWQFTAASYSGALVILIAQKIDRMPALSPMVFKKKLPK